MSIAGTSLEVMAVAVTAALGAQLLKCGVNLVFQKPVDFRLLVHTGGMPSSHSALVASVATSVGLIDGYRSTTFAVAFALAAIVMYDAAGLRRAAGKMAGILNRITEDLYIHRPDHVPDRLRELLGHTPVEVIAGAVFGVLIAYAYHIQLSGS
ncbi:divergent PAP2 family protein [Vampirovibrio sp.]|uniref:divergent PAP2 family protein n=1 Tax=Vampirovibrio sp. TaxID=2717857 RepID=UPI0035935F8E